MQQEISLSLSQFRDAWANFVSAVPGSVCESIPGFNLLFSGLPIPFFNVGILNQEVNSDTHLKALAEAALARTASFQLPWFLVLTKENLGIGVDPDATLAGLGLVPLVNLTGMIADEVAPLEKLPESLSLTLPEDDEGCVPMITINQEAYGMDLQAAMETLGTAAFWRNGRVPVVGLVDGTPVSCSAVIPVDGHHYVAFVATRPEFQRRGFADAAMRHSLTLAAEKFGKRKTFLHATDAGLPVYARMGYKPVAHHSCYIEEKYLLGH